MARADGSRATPPAEAHQLPGEAGSEEDSRTHGARGEGRRQEEVETPDVRHPRAPRARPALGLSTRARRRPRVVGAARRDSRWTPTTNHLAVHVEDHPLDYGKFEGTIPKGEYGAGHVTIWDHGTYDTEKWRTNEVMVVLHGTRASGRYVLFPIDEKNWMIHRMDPAPAYFEAMPQHVKPMLAMAGELPNKDAGWAYEFKWDGVRAMRLRRRRAAYGRSPATTRVSCRRSPNCATSDCTSDRARRSWTARSSPSTRTVARTSRRSPSACTSRRSRRSRN